MALFVTALIALLILSHPLYVVIVHGKAAWQTLRHSIGTITLCLCVVLLGGLFFYHLSIEQLVRNETLGFGLTALGLLIIASLGWRNATQHTALLRLSETLLYLGYAGTAGALLAGMVQFSIVTICGLALLHLFNRLWFHHSYGGFAGVALSFIIPLGMLLTLHIGHGLAVPLIASFIAGMALNLPRATEVSLTPPK
jgi:hypothetical protein